MTTAQIATMEQQYEIIRDALEAAHKAGRIDWDVLGRARANARNGAYLDAVLVMMPEGWGYEIRWEVDPDTGEREAFGYVAEQKPGSPAFRAYAATPALALLEAIQKAWDA